MWYDTRCVGVQRERDGILVRTRNSRSNSSDEIECKYLIGADGVNSKIRSYLNIKQKGVKNMQNFINIHFSSKELGQKMIELSETGMLYFLYGDSLISVLVCHNIKQGEFVLQVPFNPPIQKKEDYTLAVCQDLVRQALFSQQIRGDF